MGRHWHSDDAPAAGMRFPALLWPFAALTVGMVGASVGMIWHASWTPTAHAGDTVSVPRAVGVTGAPAAGPLAPIFDWSGVAPYDPGKSPSDAPTTTAVPRSTNVPINRGTRPATSRTPSPQPTPVPTGTPAPADDGTFGDGCEQPGDPVRCHPVGFPPVPVPEPDPRPQPQPEPAPQPDPQPDPAPVVDEPPVVPAEEEPPVDVPEAPLPTEWSEEAGQ